MMQQNSADDYVVETGETHSVQDFVDATFEYAGLDVHKFVKNDLKYFHPTKS